MEVRTALRKSSVLTELGRRHSIRECNCTSGILQVSGLRHNINVLSILPNQIEVTAPALKDYHNY